MNRQQATEELAKQVMGWHKETYTGFFIPRTVPYTWRWLNQNGSWVASTQWNPWDNIADAMMLLEALAKGEYNAILETEEWTTSDSVRYCWKVSLQRGIKLWSARGCFLEEAITLTVCKAYGIEISDET